MRKLLSVVAGLVVVAGSANGQATVDYGTRTITATAGSTTPLTPGQVSSAGGVISGVLDTHLLTPSATQYLVYRLSVPTLSAGIAGFTDPTGYFEAARASIWLNGHVDDLFILPNGLNNGYGNEFNVATDGSLFLSYMTASYTFSVRANTSTFGQGAGASAQANAGASIVGVDAVDNGQVVSSAIFDQNGNGYFTATVPEPSSIALLATGLLGIVPFARRRGRV